MKRTLFSLAIGAAIAVSAPAFAADNTVADIGSPATRSEVLNAVNAWRKAVIDKDRAGLEQAYHDDLIYGHSDGHVVGKKEQIDRTIVPDRDFTAVGVDGLAVRAYEDIAYVTTTYTFHILPKGGEARQAKLPSLDVWTKGAQGWQLIARQLTKAPQ